MKESANHKVGLSQFKMEEVIEQVKPKKNNGAEIKLSDLMRRA